jgi:NAD(P)-dependent dehydrogenase (short-subunit alcohol dehydrogenase family)
MTEADWDRVLDVNLKGLPLRPAAARAVAAGRGGAINLRRSLRRRSSLLGEQGRGQEPTRAMALALAPHRIRAGDRPWLTDTAAALRQLEAELVGWAGNPAGRPMAWPEEITRVAVFLAAEESGWPRGRPSTSTAPSGG